MARAFCNAAWKLAQSRQSLGVASALAATVTATAIGVDKRRRNAACIGMGVAKDMPVDLVLVRHGQSEGNLFDNLKSAAKTRGGVAKEEVDEVCRMLGTHTSEWRLTDLGRQQARRAGQMIQHEILDREVGRFDKFFCSSYIRAMETAACMNLPHSEYRTSLFLREKDSMNEWERAGLDIPDDFKQLQKQGSLITNFYSDVCGLESPSDLIIRVGHFVNHLCQEHAGQRVVIVCHGHVIKAFRILLTDVSPTQYKSVWGMKVPNCYVDWYSRRDPEGKVHTFFAHRTGLALKDAKDITAPHFEVDRDEEALTFRISKSTFNCERLLQEVHMHPQSINNHDFKRIFGDKA